MKSRRPIYLSLGISVLAALFCTIGGFEVGFDQDLYIIHHFQDGTSKYELGEGLPFLIAVVSAAVTVLLWLLQFMESGKKEPPEQ
jgi:hypothetical protein